MEWGKYGQVTPLLGGGAHHQAPRGVALKWIFGPGAFWRAALLHLPEPARQPSFSSEPPGVCRLPGGRNKTGLWVGASGPCNACALSYQQTEDRGPDQRSANRCERPRGNNSNSKLQRQSKEQQAIEPEPEPEDRCAERTRGCEGASAVIYIYSRDLRSRPETCALEATPGAN
jgi:hypothetical protein